MKDFLKWLGTSLLLWALLAGTIILFAVMGWTGPFVIAALLPTTMFVVAYSILRPITILVSRTMPDCKLKRLLLYRYS